jgi:prepilin-type processing-associated H-X9-DG protein
VWTLNILAELEETALSDYMYQACEGNTMIADDLEHNVSDSDAHPQNVSRWTPDAYLCPSADKMTFENRINTYDHDDFTSKGNYAACWGSDGYLGYDPNQPLPPGIVNKRGAFNIVMIRGWKNTEPDDQEASRGKWKLGLGQGTKLGQISDGTSNTLMVSEVLGFDSSQDGRGGWVLQSMGASNFSAKYEPNAQGVVPGTSLPKRDRIALCDTRIPPADPLFCDTNRADDQVWAAARSRHQGGVNASLCDASVRFVTNSINIDVWRAMSTRDGGEAVADSQ